MFPPIVKLFCLKMLKPDYLDIRSGLCIDSDAETDSSPLPLAPRINRFKFNYYEVRKPAVSWRLTSGTSPY